MRRYNHNQEQYPFLLNKHQQFDLIRGAWCSASRGTETLELFVNKYLYHLRPDMVDFLWAMVYRDLYLPCYGDSNALATPSLRGKGQLAGVGRGWDGERHLLHFLAAFNIRNWSRLAIDTPNGMLGVLTYRWHGDDYIIEYPTAFAGKVSCVDTLPTGEGPACWGRSGMGRGGAYHPWSSIVPPEIILSRLPNSAEQNHINHQLSLITHSAYEDLTLYS